MEEEKKMTQRELNFRQLLELKTEWPEIIFAVSSEGDKDYCTMAICFHGFAKIIYKYHDWHFHGFYISFTEGYVPDLHGKFYETADDAMGALMVWVEKKGYKFKKYEKRVIDNQLE